MKAMQLRPYQTKAIFAIQEALMHDQKRVAIEMPTGFGQGMVFAKTIEHLQKTNVNKILVVVGNLNLKEKITREILANYNGFVSINSSNRFLLERGPIFRSFSSINFYRALEMCNLQICRRHTSTYFNYNIMIPYFYLFFNSF